MKLKFYASLFFGVIALTALVMYSRPIAEFMVGLFYEPDPLLTPLVLPAKIGSFDGVVLIDRTINRDKTTFPAQSQMPLHQLDKIRTEKGSKVTIMLDSGWEVQLNLRTTAIIEAYRQGQSDSPLLLTLVYGDYTVIKSGTLGSLYISMNKKVFSPQENKELTPRQILINKTSPENMVTEAAPAISDQNEKSMSENETSPSAARPGKMPEKIKTGDEETLSNQYIEGVLNEFLDDFRKCQMNSLRDNKNVAGSLLYSLTIEPTGRPKNIKLLQNSTKNSQLADCSKSVLERARFRTFSGLPITITYPLEFK